MGSAHVRTFALSPACISAKNETTKSCVQVWMPSHAPKMMKDHPPSKEKACDLWTPGLPGWVAARLTSSTFAGALPMPLLVCFVRDIDDSQSVSALSPVNHIGVYQG